MAKTLYMAPNAPRPANGGKAAPTNGGKAHSGKPAAGHRPVPGHHGRPVPHHPAHPHPSRSHRSLALTTALVLSLTAAGAALWAWQGGTSGTDPGTQLLAEMEAAAQGRTVPTHAFGGSLTVVQGNGPMNVVAEGVPSRACVQVGWRLAKQGTIIVNGTLPQRLSAAKLSDLCSGDDATLTWIPDQ